MKHFSLRLITLLLMLSMPWLANATAPFTEGFESSSLPEKWTTIHVSGSPTWQTVRNNYYVAPHSGDYSAMVSYAYSGGADNYLVTPLLTPVAGEVLQFYLASQSYTGTTVTIEVSEASNTDAVDFTTVLATYQSNVDITNKWGEAKELSLSTYAGKQIYVAFHVIDDNGGNIYVDDVSIIAPVSCAKPLDFVATATPDGAQLTWKGEEGSQYQYCIVAAGETPAGWQLLEAGVFAYTATGLIAGNAYDAYVRTYCSETEQSTAIKQTFTPVCNAPAKIELAELTHNTATLSWTAVAGISQYQYLCVLKDSTPDWEGVEPKEVLNVTIDTLQPSTAYDFHVRSYFSASVQSEAVKTTFTTNCVAATLPYSETFDNATTLPVCWEASNVSNAKWQMYTYSDESKSGYCIQFSGKNSATATLKTPAIELSEKTLLKFYWKNASAISVKLQISTNGGSTKADIDTDLSSAQSSLIEKTIDLSAYEGETITLYFEATNTTSSNRLIYLDELSITAKPCSMPKQLKAEASSSGAVVTWKAGNDEAEWNLRYRAVGDEEWKEHTALTEAVDTLSGMAAATEYEVQVQASCSADKQSEWTASATFTPVCPVPSRLAVNVIEEDRAIVVWECTESVFHLQYKAADAAEWQTVDSIEAKNYELTNLESSSTYQVRVQTACGSAYTNAVSFTTRCAPLTDTIPYVVPMDSVVVGSMPECWFVLPRTAEVAVTLMNDSTHRLLIAGEQECWIVLPELDAELNGLTVSVTWSGSSLKDIGYLTAADEQTYEPMAEFSTMPAECDFRNAPAEAKYVAIHYVGTTEYSIGYIAQVQIAESAGETAIDTTSLRTEAAKCLENGQLFIIRHGHKYNAQGTIVK